MGTKANKTPSLEDKVMLACGSVNYARYGSERDDATILSLVNLMIACFQGYTPIDEWFIIPHTETDTLHIHFVLKLSKQVRLKTLLYRMSVDLQENTLAINIKKMSSINAQLRYDLHIDDDSISKGKKMYDIKDYFSNMTTDVIQSYIDSDDDSFSFFRLIEIIMKLPIRDEVYLMSSIGLKMYHKYRYEIRQCFENIPLCEKLYEQHKRGEI